MLIPPFLNGLMPYAIKEGNCILSMPTDLRPVCRPGETTRASFIMTFNKEDFIIAFALSDDEQKLYISIWFRRPQILLYEKKILDSLSGLYILDYEESSDLTCLTFVIDDQGGEENAVVDLLDCNSHIFITQAFLDYIKTMLTGLMPKDGTVEKIVDLD
ncbi:MAG: hypothetical protein JW816_02250 [Candidatus Buchananbacteria bacterium]|nr:hypothetical protein [Candidatus Buchananbacteria bacterium]